MYVLGNDGALREMSMHLRIELNFHDKDEYLGCGMMFIEIDLWYRYMRSWNVAWNGDKNRRKSRT